MAKKLRSFFDSFFSSASNLNLFCGIYSEILRVPLAMRLSLFSSLLFHLLHFSVIIDAFFGLASKNRKLFADSAVERWSTGGSRLSNNLQYLQSNKRLCKALHLKRRQRDMCRVEHGLAETLDEAMRLAVLGCQTEFKHELWNCSLGTTRINLLKKAYKETAFMYAMTSSSLVYAFSRACSRGQLDGCSCGTAFNEPQHYSPNAGNWFWRGCSDNVFAGRKMVQRFINRRAKPASGDPMAIKLQQINQHNFDVGLKMVRTGVEQFCKCHGVSGSCTVRSCWKTMKPMKNVTRGLKKKYLTAKHPVDGDFETPTTKARLTQKENEISSNFQLHQFPYNVHISKLKLKTKPQKPAFDRSLWYMDDSPNFCERTATSVGASGRECLRSKHPWASVMGRKNRIRGKFICESMCCGRGHHIRYETIEKKCNCSLIKFVVHCDLCRRKQLRYFCN